MLIDQIILGNEFELFRFLPTKHLINKIIIRISLNFSTKSNFTTES